MHRHGSRHWVSPLCVVVLASGALSLSPSLASTAAAATPSHLPARLNLNARPLAAATASVALSPSSAWSFGLILPSQNAAGLAAYAQAVSDPASPQYRKFLTPAQVAALYGPAPSLVGRLEAYLAQKGFTATLSGQVLQVSGTVAQVDALFSTTLVEQPAAPQPPGPPGGLARGRGPGQFLRVAPATALSIPSALRTAVGITGLTRGNLTPLSTGVSLASQSEVRYASAADLPAAPTGPTAQATSGAFTVTAQALETRPIAPGMAYHWLITASLNGQPDPTAALTGMAGDFQGAPGFVDTTVTNQAGQFVLDTTVSQAQSVRFAAQVSSDPGTAGAATATVALPVATFKGAGINTCPLGPNGEAVICPFDPAYNSLNAAYDATGLAAVPAAKGAATVAVYSATSEDRISKADVAAFANTFGLAAPSVSLAYRGAGTCASVSACQSPGYEEEMSLDLQMIETASPGASILIYAAGSLRDALNAVDVQDRAKVFSISYGAGEIAEYDYAPGAQAGWDLLAEEANVEGITISVAAGDSGGFEGAQFGLDQPMPSYPANSPYVSALGATETAVSPSGVVLQSALWGGSLGAELPTSTLLSFLSVENMMGGGGVSQLEPEPAWQLLARPAAGRINPDFSFDGSVVTPGILAFYDGTAYLFGGTSADAPLFAGWVADMAQAQGTPLGNVNPAVYALSRTSPGIVMPVAYGNNGVYAVTPGLNPVTGLGALDMGRLAAALASPTP